MLVANLGRIADCRSAICGDRSVRQAVELPEQEQPQHHVLVLVLSWPECYVVLSGHAAQVSDKRDYPRNQPTRRESMETEPPSTPSTGNVKGSEEVRVPAT